jgi:hypothetical protein
MAGDFQDMENHRLLGPNISTHMFEVVSPPRHRVIQCVVLFYLDFKGGKPWKQNEIDVVNDGKPE